jgi:hypothetical protein
VRLCAAAASLAFSLPVGAQLEIVLEPRTSIVESAVASDGAIWLQTETPVGPSNRRYALIRVSPDLDSYHVRELPNSFLRGVSAFRDGVLTRNSEPGFPGSSSQQHLHWIGPQPDAVVASWYTWSNNAHADTFKSFLAPASDGPAVYVISRELGAQLSKLEAITSDEDLEAYRDPYSLMRGTPRESLASAAVAPASVEEVQQVVLIANRSKTPIYPISTGKNYANAVPRPT